MFMNKKFLINIIILNFLATSFMVAQNGILNVGFDIDDTVLF